MATIYRFIVENRVRETTGRKSSENAPSRKSPAKKGKWVAIIGGSKGGVEHNRKLRAVNPLFNKMTGGAWERGMRVGRASLGLVKQNTETGELKLSGAAIAIIIAFIIQMLLKWQAQEYKKAQQRNEQNFKQLENGIGAIRGEYKMSTNIFNGRHTYNQNK